MGSGGGSHSPSFYKKNYENEQRQVVMAKDEEYYFCTSRPVARKEDRDIFHPINCICFENSHGNIVKLFRQGLKERRHLL